MAELSDSPRVLTPAASRTAASLRAVAVPRPEPAPKIGVGRIALACGELALASLSVYLCAQLFALPTAQLDGFIADNALELNLRGHIFLAVIAAVGLPVAVAAALLARYKWQAAAWLVRAGELCAPLMLSCFLPSLLDYHEWYDRPLPYLLQLLAFVLLLERLLTRALSHTPLQQRLTRVAASWRSPSRIVPLAVVLIASTAYAVYMSYYTILRHRMLGTAGFDLGIFDNLMMNALHGRPFRSTVAVPLGSYLSNHAEYGMFLFVPLYALHPGPETLLVLQSVFMGFAAVPLYYFATTQISRAAAAAIACAYLIYAPLHGPNFYDFHWMPMSMFFVYWLFYAIARRKAFWVALLCAVVCAMREDAAFGVIATGLFLIVTGYWPRAGAWLSAVGAAWFVLVKFVIMPWAGPWWFADIYKDLMAHGEKGYGSVVRTILINPNYFLKTLLTEPKFIYALHLLAPLGLLSVRHPALMLLMLPGFFVTLMTTGYAPTISIAFQYTTSWIPFLFAALAIALALRARKGGPAARRASVWAVCIGVACHSVVFGAIFQHEKFVGGFSRVRFEMTPSEWHRYGDLNAIIKRIPPEASVAATETEIPHVSTRLDAYTLKVTAGGADYLLVDRYHVDAEARQQLRSAMQEEPYGLLAKQGEFLLFKKHFQSKETDSALRTLGLHGVHARS